ncbi:MAG: hypothetical protein AMJ69_00885 [Gammaproteobacteria bacterium SG8_47]|nr:MAG: hypothetical protein AMJ69_00885 [Gammaproteobacteria bacterium SG8_47]
MKRRLYFVLPNLDSAREIHNELLLSRVEERHMHYLAGPRAELGDLPRANLLQSSDLVHGLQLGLIYGGISGIFAGIVAVVMLGLTLQSGGIVVLGVALAGALMGAWSSSMIAVAAPNFRLIKFDPALRRGGILLLIDVPIERVDEITALIRRYHPEADARGVEPTIPAFP